MELKILLFIILIKFALIRKCGGELRLRPSGPNFVRSLGSSMVLTCEYVSDGDEDGSSELLVWLDNRGQVVGTHSKSFTEDDSSMKKLYVVSISEQDAGEYKCIKGHESKSFFLQIFKDITFDDAPSVQYLNVTSDGFIRCVASGNPDPRISWRKNSRRITMADQPRFIETREGLKVSNVTRDDGGWYTCRAEVDVDGRYEEQRIQVLVNYPPVIVGNLERVEVLLGSRGSVSCVVQGFPQPLVNFTKLSSDDEEEEEEEPISSAEDVLAADDTLTFANVSKSHEGRYRCTATNVLGRHSQTFSLRVLVPPEVILPPFVMTRVGSTVTVTCLGLGDPMPYLSVIRKMDGRNLMEEEFNDGGRMQTTRSSGLLNLTIADVNVDDSGVFVCSANSSVGLSAGAVRLVVQYAPKFEEASMTPLVFGWGDQVVQLKCNVHGEPKVNVQWFKGHESVENNGSFQEFKTSSGSVLQVSLEGDSGEELYGMYTCRATNDLGSEDFNITLKRPSVPTKPEVRVMSLRPDEVTIRMTCDLRVEDDFRVTHYLISIQAEGGATRNLTVSLEDMEPTSNLAVATTTIGNLAPNATYVVLATAVNSVGPGTASKIEVQTRESSVPDEVSLNATSLDSKSITLNWMPPYSGGSNITGYVISHRKVKSSEIKSVESRSSWKENFLPSRLPPSFVLVPTGEVMETSYRRVPPRDILTFEIVDLEPSSSYQVKVVAVNDVGSSPAQLDIFVQTKRGAKGFLPSFLQTSSSSILIAVVLGIVAVIVVIVDVLCYVTNDCGLLMCCCVLACRKSKKHSVSPRKGKADKREFDDLISSKKPQKEGVDHLPEQTLDAVVIDDEAALEANRKQTENHVNEASDDGGKEEERCPLVEEKRGKIRSDVDEEEEEEEDEEVGRGRGDGDDDDDDDGDELPSPPLLISGLLHVEKSELITPKNRRSIMNFGDARWKDVVHELESQLGVKKPEVGEDEEEEEEDEYTGPSSPKWRHT